MLKYNNNYILFNFLGYTPGRALCVGLQDGELGGPWMWIDGTLLSPNSGFWDFDTPDATAVKSCAALTISSETAGNLEHTRLRLRDINCFYEFNYLCEAPPL